MSKSCGHARAEVHAGLGVRFLAGKYSNQDDREDEDHGQTEVLHLYHGSVACDFVFVSVV